MALSFKLLKVSKTTSLEIYICPWRSLYISMWHGEARNIKFGQQVKLIWWVPLGTLPQGFVTSLPQRHMTLTNLFTSCYRATVIKFGPWKQLLHRSPWGTSPLGVVMPLPFDHVTLINLYTSSYREATRATFIHANT